MRILLTRENCLVTIWFGPMVPLQRVFTHYSNAQIACRVIAKELGLRRISAKQANDKTVYDERWSKGRITPLRLKRNR